MNRTDLAKTLAKKSGEIALQWFRQENEIISKSETDVVLTADLEAEKFILEQIRIHFPDDAILSEEAGSIESSSSIRWIIDPLDGTVNFNAGLPYFCTSVGIEEKGEMVFAAIYDPLNLDVYTAERGKGAFCNNEKLCVSSNTNLRKSIISAMSRFKTPEAQERGTHEFLRILQHCRTIRIQGCSMLELCKVAQGSYDGFIKIYGAYEDFATGALIVEEAGGKVTDDEGKPWGSKTQSIIASNGVLHSELMAALQE